MANRREREREEIVYGSVKSAIEKRETEFQPASFRLPPDMPLFRFEKAKLYELDIIPYRIGKGNPYAAEGTVWYERTYYTHKIGVDNKHYCCPQKILGKNCPVCQEYNRLRVSAKATKEQLSELRPKERQLWLVIDRDDPDKGIQLMECAYYGKGAGFGEMLDNKMGALKENDPKLNFFYLKGGQTLQVKTKQDSYAGRTFFKPINIELAEREEDYPTSLLKEAPCLDELLVIQSYDKLKKIFLSGSEEEEEEELQDQEEDIEEEEVDGEGYPDFTVGDEVTFKYRGKECTGTIEKVFESKALAHVDVGEERPKVVKFDELSLVDSSEEDEEPATKKRGRPKKEEEEEIDDSDLDDSDLDNESLEDEPFDDGFDEEEEEEEEEEEPAPKKRGPKKGRR